MNIEYVIIAKLEIVHDAQNLELKIYDSTSSVLPKKITCLHTMPRFVNNFHDSNLFIGNHNYANHGVSMDLHGIMYDFRIVNAYWNESYDDMLLSGSYCNSCAYGKFMDMDEERRTGLRKESCTDCPSGKFSITEGATSCELCPPCPDQHYRVGCTSTGDFGYCKPCDACGDGERRVDCINRAGHNDEGGRCEREDWVSSTPMCRSELVNGNLASIGLGGFGFESIFGADENHTKFQCSQTCDALRDFIRVILMIRQNINWQVIRC